MKRQVGSTVRFTTVISSLISGNHGIPISDVGAAERIRAQLEPGASNSLDINDILQIIDIGRHEVALC